MKRFLFLGGPDSVDNRELLVPDRYLFVLGEYPAGTVFIDWETDAHLCRLRYETVGDLALLMDYLIRRKEVRTS